MLAVVLFLRTRALYGGDRRIVALILFFGAVVVGTFIVRGMHGTFTRSSSLIYVTCTPAVGSSKPNNACCGRYRLPLHSLKVNPNEL